MKNIPETQKMCRIDDPITNIGYKIIYRTSKDRYEIWTQYKDKNGKLRRKRVTYDEAIRREHDLESLTDYVREYLVGMHIRFYDDACKQSGDKNRKSEEKVSAVKPSANPKEKETPTTEKPDVKINILPGSKSEQLEQLFLEWESAQKNEPDVIWILTNGGNTNITKEHFRRDGIIDEATFEKEKVKVLFISAEANDNEYSALTNSRPNSVDDYREYHFTGNETWKGRMRERLAELYKVVSGMERGGMSNPEAAMHFAIMDINKRGGGPEIKGGKHLKAYCKHYAGFIRREIEIIDPDIVAIVGTNLYDMGLHKSFLGAFSVNGKSYFDLSGKKVPILSLWQTSYYQGKNEPLAGYEDNRTIGKQAERCVNELKRFGLR